MIAPVFNRTVEKEVMRRWLLCGVAFVAMGLEAGAADMPDFLRGSNTVIAMPGGPRWDGFYVGGHVGWSVPGIDFTNNTDMMERLVRMARRDERHRRRRSATPIPPPRISAASSATSSNGMARWSASKAPITGSTNR